MSESIMQQGEPECFICSSTRNLECHHVLFGKRFKKKADKFGLWVWLCVEHHRGNNSPHMNREIDLDLKSFAQSCFEESHSRFEWMAEFGRNYLAEGARKSWDKR